MTVLGTTTIDTARKIAGGTNAFARGMSHFSTMSLIFQRSGAQGRAVAI